MTHVELTSSVLGFVAISSEDELDFVFVAISAEDHLRFRVSDHWRIFIFFHASDLGLRPSIWSLRPPVPILVCVSVSDLRARHLRRSRPPILTCRLPFILITIFVHGKLSGPTISGFRFILHLNLMGNFCTKNL
ncbi:uncharacterized protein LOC127787485 [Diospyros lotus]|uniref:uncharacterized protein LOC127787485 n=1 Tax=Diospyros lotus TaxID=55363 RepID=UPI00225B6F00|nr:uncharacterized protein LOC127787485 [Diospyros lotus]